MFLLGANLTNRNSTVLAFLYLDNAATLYAERGD